MKILVTGARGLIGYEIADHAQRAGHQVVSVDDGRAAVVPHALGERIDLPVEDLAARHDVDVVVHCAAPVGPVGILGRPVLAEMLTSTYAAAMLSEAASCPLVVFSSSEVYGTRRPTGHLVVPDEWSYRNEYAVGKIATEQIARRHHRRTSLPTLVIRPWNVVGPAQAASKGFVIPRMAAQAARGERPTVYRPGDQQRAFMHVRDLAAATVAFLRDTTTDEWDGTPIDAAAPGNATTMIDLAHRFADRIQIIDPASEHGPDFREAAAGTKLPPAHPRIEGTTPLSAIIAETITAASVHFGVAA